MEGKQLDLLTESDVEAAGLEENTTETLSTHELLSRFDLLAEAISFVDTCIADKNIDGMKENEFGLYAENWEETAILKNHLITEAEEYIIALFNKGGNIIEIITRYEAEAASFEAMTKAYLETIDGYKKGQKRAERKIEYLKNFCIRSIIERFGNTDEKGKFILLNKIKCRIQKSESVVVEESALVKLPDYLKRIVIEPKKTEIKELLKKGVTICEGVLLAVKEHVRIYR